MVQAASASVGRLRGVRVLVVEDDADTRDLVDVVLVSEGAVTTLATGGHEAFDAFARRRPDLVLSDLRMPDGDGYELARRIRELSVEDGKLTPAVAVSASENARPAILAGYHAFVAKPFDVDQLVDVVEDFTRPPERVAHEAPWTIAVAATGSLVLTLAGDVTASDMARLVDALLVHLEDGPCELVVDLRRLGWFAPSAASVAERRIWARRKNLRQVRILGGPVLARIVSAAACGVLGVPVTLSTAPEGGGRDEP